MPERKPRSSAVALTALLPNPFGVGKSFAESSLERDLLRIVKSRRDVISSEVQPLTIPWTDSLGKTHSYTPDLRLVYKPGSRDDPGDKWGRPLRRASHIEVFEVKYYNTLKREIAVFRPAFQAARIVLAAQGVRFTVLTERTIRTLALDHAHFFNGYKHRQADPSIEQEVVSVLSLYEETTAAAVTERISSDPWRQAEVLAVIWILVARGTVEIEHSVSPSRNSKVWLVDLQENIA
jgi:hypothetical protein